MSSIFGKKIKVSIFGQSHSDAIGVTIDGLPAGVKLDIPGLQDFMNRRAPGKSPVSTTRNEKDIPEFLSGLVDDTTCGAPLTAIIKNNDTRSKDYSDIKRIPRPGHADYTAHIKYDGFEDYRGGGHFSGRLTAPLCIAGGIAIQILDELGISIRSEILEIGGEIINSEEDIERIVLAAKSEGDSVGGIVECRIDGVPVGVGDPIFDGVENRISQAVFGVPAIKGIEFGMGFDAAKMRGSENNDPYYISEEEIVTEKRSDDNPLRASVVRTRTNNAGGILGGIANGEEIVFRVAVKPTPSIAKEQDSIDYETGENVKLLVKGRHDPCIVPRVLPCIESAAAIAILDLMI